MVREKNPTWEAHASHFAPTNNKNKSYEWTCKYCGKTTSSGLTRFEEHLAKVGGNIAPCKGVPQAIADEVFKRIQANPRRKHNFVEIEETVPSHAPPSRAHAEGPTQSTTNTSSPMASCGMMGADASDSDTSRRAVRLKQPTIVEASGGKVTLRSTIEQLQHEAEGEIACTIIECNLSFNVLQTVQWKKMVVAISKAGYQEGWTGLSYHEMRTTKLDEERARIDRLLDPVRAGWAKYGCSILSDGWSDQTKRGLINILVSCPLGTYFLRAVDSARGGKKTSAEFIYRHIREAILEVKLKFSLFSLLPISLRLLPISLIKKCDINFIILCNVGRPGECCPSGIGQCFQL